MKYVVYSQMMVELTPSLPRFARLVLLPLCYLGALIAPTVILSIPFQVFQKHEVSPFAFWVTAAFMGAGVLWLLYRTATCAVRSLRQRVLHVEAILLSVALGLAVITVVWLYPPK